MVRISSLAFETKRKKGVQECSVDTSKPQWAYPTALNLTWIRPPARLVKKANPFAVRGEERVVSHAR